MIRLSPRAFNSSMFILQAVALITAGIVVLKQHGLYFCPGGRQNQSRNIVEYTHRKSYRIGTLSIAWVLPGMMGFLPSIPLLHRFTEQEKPVVRRHGRFPNFHSTASAVRIREGRAQYPVDTFREFQVGHECRDGIRNLFQQSAVISGSGLPPFTWACMRIESTHAHHVYLRFQPAGHQPGNGFQPCRQIPSAGQGAFG